MKKVCLIISFFITANIFGMNDSFGPHLFKGKKKITDTAEEYEVTMWEEEEIHLEPGETKTKTLYRNGLGGCTAYALIVKCKNQSLHAQMSHYPRTDHNKQKLELLKANKKFETLCDNEVEFKKLLIMQEKEWVKKNETWEQTVSKYDDMYSKQLGAVAGISPKILPYSSMLSVERNYSNDFELSLNNKKSYYSSKSDHYIPHDIIEEKNN